MPDRATRSAGCSFSTQTPPSTLASVTPRWPPDDVSRVVVRRRPNADEAFAISANLATSAWPARGLWWAFKRPPMADGRCCRQRRYR
eukprot:4170164-Prymnesium_polylepis.1